MSRGLSSAENEKYMQPVHGCRDAYDAHMETASSRTGPQQKLAQHGGIVLLLAYCGFISLGIPDTVAGIAWPGVRETFTLPQSGLGLVFIALGCGYLTSSVLAGKLMQKFGMGTLLVGSTWLVAAAMLSNSLAPAWPLFVASAVVWGLGSGAIDSGLNAYAARHFSARHVNWLHAFYSLGATLGPLLMTAMLLRTHSWRLGYLLVAAVVAALAVAFTLTRRHWDTPTGSAGEAHAAPLTMGRVLARPLVWVQIAIFFLYTGLELMVGQWAFTLFTESRGFSIDTAGPLVGGYFGAIGIGRVLLGALVERIGVDRLVRLSLLAVIAGSALLAWGSASGSVVGLILLGLGLAPVFPCLMSRTPERLGGDAAAHAIGFQVAAATTGVAVLPGLAGALAERTSLEIIPLLAFALALLITALHETILRLTRT